MVRPRFHRLAPEQQQVILRAALDEFAAHGFHAASLNRIIERAGISKGSLYYYFDDKEDLYAHIASSELHRLMEVTGPFPIPTSRDPEAFWAELKLHYLRILSALLASPQLAALARDWLQVSASPALQQAQRELERALLPWFEQALAAGQQVRAVRKDVPRELLIAVAFGMGQAMDGWLMAQQPDARAVRRWVKIFMGMLHGALAPAGR